jgi:hypothetical protein
MRPTAAVAQVMSEMQFPPAWDLFAAGPTDGLINHLIGVVARSPNPSNSTLESA